MGQEIITINLGGVNCYLVKTGKTFVLIDSGLSSQRARMEKELERAGCRPGNLKLIVLTHGDIDHAGNCAYLRERFGAKIAMHPAEAEAVERGDMLVSRKRRSFLATIIFSVFNLKKSERFKPDFTVGEGYDLSGHDFDARVLHLPGHSLGSIGFLTGDGDLFCGDLLVNVAKPARNTLIDQPEEYNRSIERLNSLGIRTIYPGHGRPFSMEHWRTL